MTNLYDGQITDLLSNSMRYNPETIAIGYAIQQEKQRLLELEAQTRLASMIAQVGEKTLDYLAVELRTPAYQDSYPLEVKRKLVAGTLEFYSHLGTPWATNWAIQSVFGAGYMEEWFQYGGTAHHFRVIVDITEVGFRGAETIREFVRIIEGIKRLSSWLDTILFQLRPQKALAIAGGAFVGSRVEDHAVVPIPELRRPGGAVDLTAGGALLSCQTSDTATIAVPPLLQAGGRVRPVAGGGVMLSRYQDGATVQCAPLDRPVGRGSREVAAGVWSTQEHRRVRVRTRGGGMRPVGYANTGVCMDLFHVYGQMRTRVRNI